MIVCFLLLCITSELKGHPLAIYVYERVRTFWMNVSNPLSQHTTHIECMNELSDAIGVGVNSGGIRVESLMVCKECLELVPRSGGVDLLHCIYI